MEREWAENGPSREDHPIRYQGAQILKQAQIDRPAVKLAKRP